MNTIDALYCDVDDRKQLPGMAEGLSGKLYGDKGCLSKELGGQLFNQGIELITNVRKNMKPRAVALWEKIMLR